MNEECIKFLIKLIKYADKDTLNRLLSCVKNSKPLVKIKTDASVLLLQMLLNSNSDESVSQLEHLFDLLIKVERNLNDKNISEREHLECIIELVEKYKTIIYWEEDSKQDIVIIYYCKLKNIINKNYEIKKFKFVRDKSYIHINKLKIMLKSSLKIHKFKSIYKLLSEELEKDIGYCRWCNPDETLKHSLKQHKCDTCKKIEEFLFSAQPQKNTKFKNKLNMRITRSKGKNLKDTISMHRAILMEEIEAIENSPLLRNVKTSFTQEITHMKKLINMQYNCK